MTDTRPFLVHEDDCELEAWDDPVRGQVRWRTLLSGDRTPTSGLTMGVAELEPGGVAKLRTHRHAEAEAYYIMSGTGVVSIEGKEEPVRAGMAVFLPGNTVHGAMNTGSDVLRLLYVFPADSFDQIEYEFPD